jgi:intein/homing endonuclease
MREFREYDDSNDTPEQTVRRMTYKERQEILKVLKMPTAEELDEITRTAAEECKHLRSEKIESYEESISNRGKRMEYGFTKGFPSIENEEITNVEELLEFIKQYQPSLMQRNDFQGLFHNAEIYLGLIADFHEHDTISSSDISRVSKETGLSKTTVREWLTTDALPRLFYLLFPRESLEEFSQKRIPDFQEYLIRMDRLCNGLDSIDSLYERFHTLYINKETDISHKSRKQTEEFFEIIHAIKKGAKSYGQIEEMTGIREEQILYRIHSPFTPRLVGMVACIPEEQLSPEKKWLPLRITGSRMKDFIQVPEMITKPEEVLDVLLQIRKLTFSGEKEESNPEFSDFGGIIAFIYFLGLTISDGNFDSSKKTVSSSDRVKLKLSKKYDWSETAGNAYCHTLNKLGFSTVKGKDEYGSFSDIPLHVWTSEKSPFFVWVRQELLGLRESRNKNEHGVQPNWILYAPRPWRIALLQGIADGDGFATTKGLYAAISTYTNQEFVTKLLKSLNIDSYSTDIAVGISGVDDIAKAAKLPMFRFAKGRQRRLEGLIPMLESMDWSRTSEDEESFILELHRQGMKVGEITEKIWEKYDRVHRRNTIYDIIERNSPKEENEEKNKEKKSI